MVVEESQAEIACFDDLLLQTRLEMPVISSQMMAKTATPM